MSRSKKKMKGSLEKASLSHQVGHVVPALARFAKPEFNMSFAYYYERDIWHNTDVLMRAKLKKLKKVTKSAA